MTTPVALTTAQMKEIMLSTVPSMQKWCENLKGHNIKFVKAEIIFTQRTATMFYIVESEARDFVWGDIYNRGRDLVFNKWAQKGVNPVNPRTRNNYPEAVDSQGIIWTFRPEVRKPKAV